jgi:putative SOS response-associated peptidase YedK
MCGRFTLRTPLSVLAERFLFDLEGASAVPRFNIAPTQEILAVRQEQGRRRLVSLHWGLIPPWAKSPKMAYSTINARADTIATKPAFRAAFIKRRCLVLADGYYEWLREGRLKQPYLYEVDGGQPFAFAGLWESWRGESGPSLESCTLITCEANALQAQIHDRMPVILDESDYDTWLDPALDDRETLERLLVPLDAARMTARPVSPEINNPRFAG